MLEFLCAYRGHIRGLMTAGSRSLFVTEHPEGLATAVYTLDLKTELPAFDFFPLPCSTTAMAVDQGRQDSEATAILAGSDGRLYQSKIAKPKPVLLCDRLVPEKIIALAMLSDRRLAVLHGKTVSVLDLAGKTVKQAFDLPAPATTLAAHAAGNWFVVGQTRGLVSVFHAETADRQFVLSGSGQIHQGDITALAFRPNDLQFYSAAQDKKLFLTHARGTLQALDKGKGSCHEAPVTAILSGENRLFTAASDKTLKAWPEAGGQPTTLKQGLAEARCLAPVMYCGEPALLLAGRDHTLRLIALDEVAKPVEVKLVIHDGYAFARDQLGCKEVSTRKEALEWLLECDDGPGFDLLQKHLGSESDMKLREWLVEQAGQAKHPKANTLLETALKDKRHETVRQQAFHVLMRRPAGDPLHPCEQALATGHADIGNLAIRALGELAGQHRRAGTLLLQALAGPARRTDASGKGLAAGHLAASRRLALHVLESLHPDSPYPSLQALAIPQPDLQRAALIRLYQRKLLGDFSVQRALLLAQDQADASLRRTAFLVAILGQPRLAQVIQDMDADLARQLRELEDFSLLGDTPAATGAASDKAHGPVKKASQKTSSAATKKSPLVLESSDYDVLLQGLSNAHADISLLAAFVLAVLQDQRALGMLLVLSQESDPAIRIGVCRAFACLAQKDSVPTLELLLHDAVAEVSDAAFTALQHLEDTPFHTIGSGFTAPHEGVHARSLKRLLEQFAGAMSESVREQALALLKQALDNPFEAIRQEAFKACLNRQLGGAIPDTLRLLLNSRYQNLHQEVLNEVMAASATLPPLAWVEPLLLELFNDNFEAVRGQAVTDALNDRKRFAPERVCHAAVHGMYRDVRRIVLHDYLRQHPGPENQIYIQQLLCDPDEQLRGSAMALLLEAHDRSALLVTLDNPHPDIRVKAAVALAQWGDPAAFPALEALLTRPEPHVPEEKSRWQQVCAEALSGLALCADVRGFPLVCHFLAASQPQMLVEAAAKALPWVTDTGHVPQLMQWQADERLPVRGQASFALALLGNAAAAVALAEKAVARNCLTAHEQLAATLNLAVPTPPRLQPYFAARESFISAVLVLMSHEFLLHGHEPVLSNGALGVDCPALQLLCAGLMVRYHTPQARWQYLHEWLLAQQDQGARHSSEQRWPVDLPALQTIAVVLVRGEGHLRARLLQVLSQLDAGCTGKAWALHYGVFADRYRQEIAALGDGAQPEMPLPVAARQDVWQQRAFGAYLGVLRQEHPARLQALRQLLVLAGMAPALSGSIQRSLLTLLNHAQATVRQLAFEGLQGLDIDRAVLGQAATASPHGDIAESGLELLVRHYPVNQSHFLLQGLIRGNHETLAPKAWALYQQDVGVLAAASVGLDSGLPALRQQVVAEVGTRHAEAAAQAVLLQATANDQFAVARLAAEILARHRHPQALDVLTRLFAQSGQDSERLELLPLFRAEGVPGEAAAAWLFGYPEQRAATHDLSHDLMAALYETIALLRPCNLFEPLLARLGRQPKEARRIIPALLAITGYDQPIEGDEDEQAGAGDQDWLKRQYPRHDALLVALFRGLLHLNYHREASELAAGLGWARTTGSADATGTAIDRALREAIPLLDGAELKPVMAAIAWRARHRQGGQGTLAGLLDGLTHTDAQIRFLAAEGLGNAGQQQGFSILLAAMDYQDNADYRRRAVLALGQSHDERALDKLLVLAEDKTHFLHEPAIEALGHLGQGEAGERIFRHLRQALKDAPFFSELNSYALNGLRWLNTLAAWQLIRDYALDVQHYEADRVHAVKLLQYQADAANRAVLCRLLRQEENSEAVVTAAYQAARKCLQAVPDVASEADYALLQGYFPGINPRLLDMILATTPSSQLLALLTYPYPDRWDAPAGEMVQALGQGLLRRQDIALADLLPLLHAQRPEIVIWAARLLSRQAAGRVPAETGFADTVATTLNAVIETCHDRWSAQRLTAAWQSGLPAAVMDADARQQMLRELLWASVHCGVFGTRLLALLESASRAEQPLQVAILLALLSREGPDVPATAPLQGILQRLQQAAVLQVSTLASELLARAGNPGSLNWQRLLAQPEVLQHPDFATVLQVAAASAEQQPLALPVLIARQDVTTLTAVAQHPERAEAVRLGAIEGLARIADPAARAALEAIRAGASDEDIAKAAYRALRRWLRQQAKTGCDSPSSRSSTGAEA